MEMKSGEKEENTTLCFSQLNVRNGFCAEKRPSFLWNKSFTQDFKVSSLFLLFEVFLQEQLLNLGCFPLFKCFLDGSESFPSEGIIISHALKMIFLALV